MSLRAFQSEVERQATIDARELSQEFPIERMNKVDLSRALMVAWYSGAQWALAEGAERISAMLPIIMENNLAAMTHTHRPVGPADEANPIHHGTVT